jgi:hypothetical protein
VLYINHILAIDFRFVLSFLHGSNIPLYFFSVSIHLLNLQLYTSLNIFIFGCRELKGYCGLVTLAAIRIEFREGIIVRFYSLASLCMEDEDSYCIFWLLG